MLLMLPLLTISLVIYIVLTVTGVGAVGDVYWHAVPLIDLPLQSGDVWRVTWGDAFLVGSMGLLFVELIRATKTDANSIVNHGLSFVLFVVTLLLFIMLEGFGNSVFFLFLCMTLLDPMAGFIVTTVTARRDFAVSDGAAGGLR